MHTANTPPPIGLLRISAAARIAGLTPRVFRESLATRQIPITTVVMGKLQHVRAAELNTWLTSAPAPAAADLFAA
jgi:hypothetical protein